MALKTAYPARPSRNVMAQGRISDHAVLLLCVVDHQYRKYDENHGAAGTWGYS